MTYLLGPSQLSITQRTIANKYTHCMEAVHNKTCKKSSKSCTRLRQNSKNGGTPPRQISINMHSIGRFAAFTTWVTWHSTRGRPPPNFFSFQVLIFFGNSSLGNERTCHHNSHSVQPEAQLNGGGNFDLLYGGEILSVTKRE